MTRGPAVIELRGGYKPAPVPPNWAAQQPPAGLATVYTLEPDQGPWSGNGKWGRQQSFEYPATLEADPIAVFSIERQPGPPRPRTLNFFRNDSQVVIGVQNADVYARIVYGVGGVQNVFFCDWSRGGQITLVCDSLRVDAVPYAPLDGTPYIPPFGAQLLGCMLSLEGSSSPRPPTFTTAQSGLVPTANSVVFAVPDFARWCFPCSIIVPADPSLEVIQFLNNGSGVLKVLTLNEELMRLGCPIPGGTSQIQIDNGSGHGSSYSLQFELGL